MAGLGGGSWACARPGAVRRLDVRCMAKKKSKRKQERKADRKAAAKPATKKAPASEEEGDAARPAGPKPYAAIDVLMHSLTLVDSYTKATGRALPGCAGLPITEAGRALFEGPFVLLSHTADPEPVFNYGSAAGLELFGLSFEELCKTPSKASAAEDEQPERAELLAEAKKKGCIDNYSGVRQTAAGRRFRIHDATVWTITAPQGNGGGWDEDDDQDEGDDQEAVVDGEEPPEPEESAEAVVGQAALFSEIEWLDDVPEEGAFWVVAEGGTWEPKSSGPAVSTEALEAAAAAVAEQGAKVRALKEDDGLANDDPQVAEAVAKLLALKGELAELEEAANAAA